jgi:hypothetical protein
MARRNRRKVANTPVDPTSAGVPIVLAGKTYHLCFDLGALAEAEVYFQQQGHDVNLLVAMPVLNMRTVLTIFPCALHKHHPDISFKDAQRMVNLETMYPIANKIAEAWIASSPEPEKKKEESNPQTP